MPVFSEKDPCADHTRFCPCLFPKFNGQNQVRSARMSALKKARRADHTRFCPCIFRVETRRSHSGIYSNSELGLALEGSNLRRSFGNLLKGGFVAGFGRFFKPDTVTWELIKRRWGRLKQRRLFGNLVKAGLGLGFGGFKSDAVTRESIQRVSWGFKPKAVTCQLTTTIPDFYQAHIYHLCMMRAISSMKRPPPPFPITLPYSFCSCGDIPRSTPRFFDSPPITVFPLIPSLPPSSPLFHYLV